MDEIEGKGIASAGKNVDVSKLLQRIILQNDIIIRQNEKLLLFLAERVHTRDEELLKELRAFNKALNKQIKLASGNT